MRPISPPRPTRSGSTRLAALVRWLHIYLSMFGFATLIFFSLTGITLNHPDWLLGTAKRESQVEGKMNSEWLKPSAPAADPAQQLARLEIVEFLRHEHLVRGAVSDFTADELECMVAFQGPGYSATAFIDRDSGRYDLTIVDQGPVALLNDLHKGRHSGGVWSLVVDLSAIVMALAGVTGLWLLFYLRRRRTSGLLTALIGGLVLIVLFYLFVP
jgi:hypothetical protein